MGELRKLDTRHALDAIRKENERLHRRVQRTEHLLHEILRAEDPDQIMERIDHADREGDMSVRKVVEKAWYEIQVGERSHNSWLQYRHGTFVLLNAGLEPTSQTHVIIGPKELRAAVNALCDAAEKG
jgi:hypothetical protein